MTLRSDRPKKGTLVREQDIYRRIDELVREEHQLRDGQADTTADRRSRLTTAEQTLDQCWDLLRQRVARREFGRNPDEAHVRDVRYQQ
ncbi:DUF2630 family protein [Streptomyces sp. PT12]|uniref:DUF2630 family protein n=1 Tax=Streptomyces sp. PT12 TaxID=1510197 RepID=UPI000DE377B7|nr:DUF2630 family protein [Streptomyces sp. PT12]RBM07309.1 DUF2630 domain-containing protein [Streptomyces sp. PT12]